MGAAFFAVLFSLPLSVAADEPIFRTLDPAISPDGQTHAFSWQGDVWTVDSSGGEARRLTVNTATDESPVWSPDGATIVFTSNRAGAQDLYRMSARGQAVRRLTWTGGNSYAYAFSPKGDWVYGQTNAYGRGNVFRVPAEGGEPVRLTVHPLEIQFTADVSPDGTKVAFCAGGSGGQWRKPQLRGSNTPDIWMASPTAPFSDLRPVTRNEDLDMYPRFVSDREMLFMSNRGGAHNVWLSDVDGRNARQVSHFAEGTIRALTVSRETRTYAFQRNSRVYVGSVNGGEPSAVTITAPDDSRRSNFQSLTLSTGISEFQYSPNGKRVLLQMRGDLFVAPEPGGTTKQLTRNPAWDGHAKWLSDKEVVYATGGTSGKRTLRKVNLDGADSTYLDDAKDLTNPLPSPDRKWVAYLRGDREIMVCAADGTGSLVVVTCRANGALEGDPPFSWSPDGEWLVVSSTNDRNGQDIVLVRRNGKDATLLTRVGKSAGQPAFLPNGKSVFYVGTEGLDFSEARDSKGALYLIDLVPEPLTFAEDDYDKLDDTPSKDEKQALPVVKVVADGLRDRKRKVLSDVNNAWVGSDSKSLFVETPAGLSRVALSGPATPRAVPGVTGSVRAVTVGAKGKVTFLQAGKLMVAGAAPDAPPSPVPVAARLTVDNRAEESALFNEIWWALDRQFYDVKMNGKDWAKIREEFAEVVPKVTSRDDFYNLMGEMVERLDSSHQGANTSEPFRADSPQSVAFLGVSFDPAAASAGRNVVDKVYAGTPAAHPDSLLKVGDEIVTVNGLAPSRVAPLGALLSDQAGRKTVVGVLRSGTATTVTMKPASAASRTGVMYQDWVDWNRKEVDRLSNGLLAYTHIASMDAGSLDTFLSDIQNETLGKSGIVVDVRFNGGGFTSHIVLGVMQKVPWLKRTFRDWPGGAVSENVMRGNSLELPAACMTNQYSFSNAEIFSEGFRRLKIGPVVGERTAGGVIGTGGFGLWDGGSIRMPAIGVYTIDGENLEANGRRPDHVVPFDPVMWLKGRDLQLEKTVAELLRSVKRGG